MAVKPVVFPSRSSDLVLQTLQWMRKHSFKPVPLRLQSKAAVSRSYVDPDYKPPDDSLWINNEYGVGMVTGPRAGGSVDIDLDSIEAITLAVTFLPPTEAIFGRKSKKASHYLYKVNTATFEKFAIHDPIDKSCIIEARGDGGHQTVMPGSLHEDTGELVMWSSVSFPDVPTVATDDLIRCVKKIGIITLIVRHIWTEGSRNEACKHLSGVFYYLDWTQEETEQVIGAICELCGDRDRSRIATVRSTYRRAQEGKKVGGAGLLRKWLKNDPLVDCILEWGGSPTVNLLQEYNERFAAVAINGKFRIADLNVEPGESPIFFGRDDFVAMYGTDYSDITDKSGKPIPKAKLWLNNPRRRSYSNVDFLPGVEESSILNLWTGWAVEPSSKGRCTAWLELVHEVICGGDAILSDWLMHWLANIRREPRNKSMTALVIVGVEGAGKTLMLEYFGRILGPSYVTVTKEDHIVGRFNQHMGNVLLLHSEEALYGGDKRHAGIIRSLITDPWHMFEPKGIDAKKVRNYMRLALTSNDIHAAPAKAGDRRYTVIDMGERKASEKLIEKVVKEMEGDGPAGLHHHLLHMSYDPRVSRTNIKNDALRSIKEIHMPTLEQWWYETLANGTLLPDFLNWAQRPQKLEWPECVSSVALNMAMQFKMRERNIRTVPSERLVAFQLDKFVGRRLARAQRLYDVPMLDDYPPAVRQMNQRQYSIINMPELAECRKAFEKYIGQDLKWPAEDDSKPEDKPEEKPYEQY